MLSEKFSGKTIFLISKSPRRKELLGMLDFPFKQIDFSVNEDESEFPLNVLAEKLAQKKAQEYIRQNPLNSDQIIITADTIVVLDDLLLGKPKDEKEAFQFLKLLSGKSHKVITGVAIFSTEKQLVFQEETIVYFKDLSDEEINYYIQNYKPFDKAGAYGIQEWIGAIGVEKITGSYFNVMGLPIQRLYKELINY